MRNVNVDSILKPQFDYKLSFHLYIFECLHHISRSAVNKVKTIGLKIPPWGTPELSQHKSDRVCPIFTLWERLERKDLNHVTVRSVKPKIESLLHRIFMSSVSKAADKSHINTPVLRPSSLLFSQSFCMLACAVIVDLAFYIGDPKTRHVRFPNG